MQRIGVNRVAKHSAIPFGLLRFARLGYNQQLAFSYLDATNDA
ncbi:MAG TPA: hypothetical protein VN025_12310 [Candidatus Dormibacteraeota bacterium]|jgi:hypothetical protein|nr:hypothetical protein [Candidatus Dormibacteraeota bacterium]